MLTFWCVFDLDQKRKEISLIEGNASDPSFWDDHRRAQQKMKQLAELKDEVSAWSELDREAESMDELLEFALEEKDTSLVDTFRDDFRRLTEKLNELEFKLVLSGEFDQRNALLAIHAGAGGLESQDWVRMLMRMYIRWAEQRGWSSEVLDLSHGEENGVKSTMLQISGGYTFGYLRSERGVHRLVRLSPFDADHARHTSFALVETLPEVEEGDDVSIDPADLKIDVFKAGGAGGQSVQKNSTAVRITHLPTGIKVSCQNERSQYQNRTIAMKILLSRLIEREMKLRAEKVAKLKGEHISPEWGNQIRSYVLQPYKLVKDHRTGFETSNAEGVLDGDIDDFVNSYLSSTVGDSTSHKGPNRK